jgi:outer membrane protein assembly factor BamB
MLSVPFPIIRRPQRGRLAAGVRQGCSTPLPCPALPCPALLTQKLALRAGAARAGTGSSAHENGQFPECDAATRLGLDRATGQTRWKVDRDSKKASFSTPCLFQPEGGRTQVILTSRAHGITSLDPASGRKNWEMPVFDLRATGSPLIAGGMIFATNGAGTAGKYLVAARPGIPEQGVQPTVLYRIKDAVPYVPTPVARWPLVFLWSDRGIATCLDGPTGKVHWRERVGGDYL